LQLLVGTYTESLPHVLGKAEGIMLCRFTEGRVSEPRLAASITSPAFLMATPSGGHVYAVSETFEFAGRSGGGLSAFARDPESGGLELLNARPTGADSPLYVAIDARGAFLLVANYAARAVGGSVTVFRRGEDGSIGEMCDFVAHVGSGPHPERQTGPHPHMVYFCPAGWPGQDSHGDVLVPDLGSDLVLRYGLGDDGRLTEKRESRLEAAPGAGPRHLRFHPNQRHLFVVNELDNTLVLVRFEGTGFVPIASVSTLAPGSPRDAAAAALRVSASGRFVFVSNRGPGSDNIVMFAFDEHREELKMVHVQPSHGEVPREFTLSPDDRYLLVANQNTDTIVTFSINEDEPGLEFVSEAELPTPVSLIFPEHP